MTDEPIKRSEYQRTMESLFAKLDNIAETRTGQFNQIMAKITENTVETLKLTNRQVTSELVAKYFEDDLTNVKKKSMKLKDSGARLYSGRFWFLPAPGVLLLSLWK